MSKVAEFINCVIDAEEYKNKEKWEVIDFFIIGFFLFFAIIMLFLLDDLSCSMNNYYTDNCNKMRMIYEYFGGNQ